MTPLTREQRIRVRYAQWLDDQVDRDLPARQFSPGVRADYRRSLADDTLYGATARLGIVWDECVTQPIRAGLDRVVKRVKR